MTHPAQEEPAGETSFSLDAPSSFSPRGSVPSPNPAIPLGFTTKYNAKLLSPTSFTAPPVEWL